MLEKIKNVIDQACSVQVKIFGSLAGSTLSWSI